MWSSTFTKAIKVKLFVTALRPEGVCVTPGGPKMQWKPQQKPIEIRWPIYLIWKILVILSSLVILNGCPDFCLVFGVFLMFFFSDSQWLPVKVCPKCNILTLGQVIFCNQNADHLATRHWLFPTNRHPPWSPAVVPTLAPVQASLVDQRSQTSMVEVLLQNRWETSHFLCWGTCSKCSWNPPVAPGTEPG